MPKQEAPAVSATSDVQKKAGGFRLRTMDEATQHGSTRDDGGLAERMAAEEERQRLLHEQRLEAARRITHHFQAIFSDQEPATDGEPVDDGLPDCDACRNTRWVRAVAKPGDENFGQLLRCPSCLKSPEIAPVIRQQAGRAAGLLDDQIDKTFENFKANRLSLDAAKAAKAWALNPSGWLVIHGEPGCGKTHLAAAAVNELLRRGEPTRLWYAPDLIDAIRATYGQDGDATGWLLKRLKDQENLVIDDLGAARPTDNTIATLEALFDYRYRDRKATLVTLIGSPDAVKQHLSESIGRRMQDKRISTVIHNQAKQWEGA